MPQVQKQWKKSAVFNVSGSWTAPATCYEAIVCIAGGAGGGGGGGGEIGRAHV